MLPARASRPLLIILRGGRKDCCAFLMNEARGTKGDDGVGTAGGLLSTTGALWDAGVGTAGGLRSSPTGAQWADPIIDGNETMRGLAPAAVRTLIPRQEIQFGSLHSLQMVELIAAAVAK